MPFLGWLLLFISASLIFGALVDKIFKHQRKIIGTNHLHSVKTDAQNEILNRDRNQTF